MANNADPPRSVIDRAVGILMAQQGCSATLAVGLLREQVCLRGVVAALVNVAIKPLVRPVLLCRAGIA